MSDLARLPSYPSPTTLIARSGIQFLDFGFDPARLRTREWGFHDAASAKSVDDLVQLDFDTALIAEAEGRAYLGPSSKDVTAGALFALAPQQAANHWLLRQGWMNQWLEELFREIHPRATVEEIEGDIKQKPQEATARYLAFLGLLAEAVHFPPVQLVGDAERPGRGAIEVDLVLDAGNSRTCGLLIEPAGELRVNLNTSSHLPLPHLPPPPPAHTNP